MTEWRPWHFARVELIRDTPDDLKIAPGANYDRLPTHADLGAPVDGFVRGRLTGEGIVPGTGTYGRDRFERRFDTNGDGVADTFVSSDPRQRDVAQSVSVGGPFGSNGTKTLVATAGAIGRVIVRGADGTKETFEPGRYERVAPGGRQEQLHDFDGDGRTDHVTIGRKSWGSSRGWPFVGYSRKD